MNSSLIEIKNSELTGILVNLDHVTHTSYENEDGKELLVLHLSNHTQIITSYNTISEFLTDVSHELD